MANKTEIHNRVNALLKQMTLEEKLAQLQGCWIHELQTDGILDPKKLETKLKYGIGQIARIGGASTNPPDKIGKIYNDVQRHLVENTRLGIPAINHEETCAGLMIPGAAIFPQMIGLASTFHPELAQEMTNAIRKHMLAIGARQAMAPVLDVARDPRWGRIEESFGEDPTLVSQFGVAYVKGLQGEDLSRAVLATGKHFVGHASSLGGLNCAPVQLGWQEIWDVFMMPFQAAIQEARLACMMNAYPELDGEVIAASKRILTDLLREQLGFEGLVVSDYESIAMIHDYHSLARSRKEAGVMALSAGIDVELPSTACYGDNLAEAVRSGVIPIELIDQSVIRHLQKKFELDLFDNPYLNENAKVNFFDSKANRKLAYKIAVKSLVLLKNEGLLPMKKGSMNLAVIGPNADSKRCMVGDYSYISMAELMKAVPGQNKAFEAISDDELTLLSVKIPTFLDVVKEKHPMDKLKYARGCDINSFDESGFPEAIDAATNADIVIMVMGGVSGLAPHCTTGEFRDSTNLGLPGVQEKLLSKVIQTGKPVILVLIGGRPVALPTLMEKTAAILEAWVPGEEGAQAIIDVLFGENSPSGKLPVSIPRSVGQVPVYYNHKPSGRRSNIFGDYLNEETTALFPFGHGLSYTCFEYSSLKIQPEVLYPGDIVDISLMLKNVGDCTAEEIVQLYVRDEFASIPRPVKELKGFVRVNLAPGETKKILFQLPVNQMAFYDRERNLVLEPGKFLVMVGSSSEDIRLNGEYEFIGDSRMVIEKRVFTCSVDIK